MKKTLLSLVVGAAITVAPLSAIAADTAGPLTPGKAAGVKQAQGVDDVPLVFWIGAGVIVTAAVLALSNNNDHSPSTTTTGTAP